MSEKQYWIDPSMVWHDIENNKEHLKWNGEHYVADATLLSENLNLRRENEMLRDENAKLRKLADAVKEFVEDTHCEDCPCRRDCDDNNRIFCADDFSYHAFAAMRELGIEATDDD